MIRILWQTWSQENPIKSMVGGKQWPSKSSICGCFVSHGKSFRKAGVKVLMTGEPRTSFLHKNHCRQELKLPIICLPGVFPVVSTWPQKMEQQTGANKTKQINAKLPNPLQDLVITLPWFSCLSTESLVAAQSSHSSQAYLKSG